MRNTTPFCIALAIAAQFAVAATASAAEPDAVTQLPTQTVRTDIRSVCPGVDKALQSKLAAIVRLAPAETVGVKFTLEGGAVSHVHVSQDSWSQFGRTVRWAVGDLGCTAPTAAKQEIAFTLHFNTSDDVPASDRVALAE